LTRVGGSFDGGVATAFARPSRGACSRVCNFIATVRSSSRMGGYSIVVAAAVDVDGSGSDEVSAVEGDAKSIVGVGRQRG